MTLYTLSAVVNGDVCKLNRRYFSSRDDAINYMFDYYRKHYMFDLQVEDEYPVNGNKHEIEYVCDYFNRFTIARI